MRPLRFLYLLLFLALGARAGALEDALRLSTHGNGVADSSQAAAMRLLVNAGMALGGQDASTWQWLDLWLAGEWEQREDLPVLRERFQVDWPRSRFQGEADLVLARWYVGRLSVEEAFPVLLDLCWRLEPGPARTEARSLLTRYCRLPLARALKDSTAHAGHPGRSRVLRDMALAAQPQRRLDSVAPFSGDKASLGKDMQAGAQAAVDLLKRGGHYWTLTTRDSQGELFLSRELAIKARDEGADAVLVPWDQESLGAMGGLQLGFPILAMGNGGPALQDLSPDLLQMDLDPAAVGALMASFVRDSLRATSLGVLAPATQPARRLLRSLLGRLQEEGGVESGQEQWYFPGARDLRAQMENLSLFSAAYPGPKVWVVLGQEGEAAALKQLVEQAPPEVTLVGDASLLSALGGKVDAHLAKRLFIIAAYLPSVYARGAGLQKELDQVFPPDGTPMALRNRAFEQARLTMLAAEEGARSGLGLLATLEDFPKPSIFGPGLQLQDGSAAGAWLLAWTGTQFTCVGGRLAVER